MSVKGIAIDYRTLGRAVKDATKRNLSRAGNYLMKAARWSLKPRKRKKFGEMTADERRSYDYFRKVNKREGRGLPKRPWASSKPSDPPRVQKGSPLKRLLLYAYYPAEEVVRIGPAKFKSSDVPRILEEGGTSTMWVRRGVRVVRRSVNVAKRPYMGPALKKSLPYIHEVWKNSIRG